MKTVPSGAPTRRLTLAEAEALARRDRRRIVLFTVGALLLAGAYITAQYTQSDGDEFDADLPARGTDEDTVVYTRPFEAPAVLETIRDATAEERLSLSGEALDELLKYSVTLQTGNYDALGVRVLDGTVAAELASALTEHRADPLRVRGRVVRLTAVATEDVAVGERQLAAVELDGGGWAHLAFLRPPVGIELGDHVRMDGMFAQLYVGMADGELREGPLVVGNQLVPSNPRIEAKEHEALCADLRLVKDDTVEDHFGEPFDALWDLMAFAAARADEVDWSKVQSIDKDLLNLIASDGTFFRGQPFQLVVCRNQDTWTESADENPLRLDRITRGWIGNTNWRQPNPLVQFIAPFDWKDMEDVEAKRLVTAKGFFLKNVSYTRRDGKSLAIAPLFVLSSLEEFVPVPDRTPEYILMGVLAGTILMIVLIFVLIRADSRSSKKLQAELVRRRRERRARTAATPQGS